MVILGSHCSMKAPKFLLGSVEEALSYGSNALMIYTGPPQNTLRKPVEALRADEAKELLRKHGITMDKMVVHAPYIINLGNCVRQETYELAVDFLRKELDRVQAIGAKYLVLHPGSYTTATLEEGMDQIVKGLNEVLCEKDEVILCLETMAGKGSEIGFTFEQIRSLIDRTNYSEKLGVCLDTCHIHDAGYDVSDFDHLLQQFDEIIGLDRLKVMHINDSKNIRGAKKDRHANLGEGQIGFDALAKAVHHEKLQHVIKILETPWIGDHAPYAIEIDMLKRSQYDAHALDALKNK
ncbi:MAG: deoxyribonuclease IV [Erysipelotrichaceae bacterium]|nr:deoxyribonuclease IV [Erysipelotrichaceae bacterium]